MRILLTRAEDAASRTAERLQAAGHEVIASPLLSIVPLPFQWPQGPFDALLATSGNAFIGMNEPGPFKALPVYTVGARTAEIARGVGFGDAVAKGQDAEALTDFLLGDLPVSARLLYLAGADRRPQVETRLRQAGRHLVTVETYRAEPAGPLTAEAIAALKGGQPLTILHFSPRTARLFLEQVRDEAPASLQNRLIRHIALSEAVAKPLREAGCQIAVAATPDEDAMLALVPDDEGEEIEPTIRSPEPPQGDAAAMSDEMSDATTNHARPSGQRPEPPTIEAVVAKPHSSTGPALTAALGGGLVGAALIGVGLWAVGPQNDYAERMAALENAVGGTATRRTVEALEKRVGTVETKLPDIEAAAKRPLPAPTPVQAPAPQTAANDDGQLTRALQEMRNDLAMLAQRLSTLEKSSADTSAKIPSPEKIDALNREIAQLGTRIAATEKNVAVNTPGIHDGSGLAIAVALKTKLQNGQPFAKELAALQSMDADSASLAVLKPYADKGLPSAAALATSFAGPARTIAATPAPRPDGDAAWTDKVSSALGRLVRVTPIDPSKGEDPVSLTVRIQTALAKDDVNEALSLWKKLPDNARRDTASFGSMLEARVNAERAITQLMTSMVDRLGAKKP